MRSAQRSTRRFFLLDLIPMRTLGAALALSRLACSDWQGTSPPVPSPPGDFRRGADATVAAGDPSSGPDGSAHALAFGPDPSPRGCDPSNSGPDVQCGSPAAVCVDGRFAINYENPWCISGACTWSKYDVDCTQYEGGTCVGGTPDAAAIALSDGGLAGLNYGCAVPLGAAPQQPVVTCDMDAGTDAAVCSAPRSVCAESAPWAIGYDNGQCVSGQCVWPLRSYFCVYGCWGGACNWGGTK
jgi:hypothetical protein